MNQLVSAMLMVLSHITTVAEIKQERLQAVVTDIVTVVDAEMSAGHIHSKVGREDAIALLAGAVTNESGFHRDYETCKKTGDGGRSLGLGQVIHPWGWKRHKKEEICNNRKLQLALALYNLDECWQITPDAGGTLRCFTSGSAKRDSGAARRELAYYKKFKAAISESATLVVSSDEFIIKL